MTEPKPTYFSKGMYQISHTLANSQTEVDGFLLRQQHEETVQRMLDKATNSIVADIKRHPPKRYRK